MTAWWTDRTAPRGAPSVEPASSGSRHREHRLCRRERGREDHLDVVADDLGVDRRGALVLSVDEFGRPIRHDVAGEGRAFQRAYDLGAVGAARAFERVGE